jgi:hypothetical protein
MTPKVPTALTRTTIHKAYEARYSMRGKTVTALVSVFNNVDLQGDRVMPHAFKRSLDRWLASGDPIPVIWSHDWANPMAHIGVVTNAREGDDGLFVEYELDVDSNPFAAQVQRLLSERRVKEHSFAYDVIREKVASDGANELLELELIEVGPTLKGANPATELLGVKAVQAMIQERPYGGAEVEANRLNSVIPDFWAARSLGGSSEKRRTYLGGAEDDAAHRAATRKMRDRMNAKAAERPAKMSLENLRIDDNAGHVITERSEFLRWLQEQGFTPDQQAAAMLRFDEFDQLPKGRDRNAEAARDVRKMLGRISKLDVTRYGSEAVVATERAKAAGNELLRSLEGDATLPHPDVLAERFVASLAKTASAVRAAKRRRRIAAKNIVAFAPGPSPRTGPDMMILPKKTVPQSVGERRRMPVVTTESDHFRVER